ncbi:hypothetical protein HR45_05205 [Shewanella mangrovi]|uniref:Uncharacterized protein n=2 Tax=Shewanella mangrovi TaxID=1515746 RepID=A0A094LUD1_9GAMM|nr:hypothetical protein HR45_05205 [Shewanella mangrovi]
MPSGNDELFRPVDSGWQPPSVTSLYQLTPAQLQLLARFVERKEIASLPKYQQLSQFLQTLLGDFNYEGQNLIAKDAMAQHQGNCMTLAMLTFAYAKAYKVPIGFRLLHDMPVLLKVEQSIATYSDHVRAYLFDTINMQELSPNPRRFLSIDYFSTGDSLTGKVVPEHEFLAMFYRNLAGEALMQGKLTHAYLQAKQGLALAPQSTPLVALMGLIHRRAGDEATAEQFYQYGLSLDARDVTLLMNYRYLADKQGRQSLAAQLSAQLARVAPEQPAELYIQALAAVNAQDFVLAERLIRQFLERYPYFHQAYLLLATIHWEQGQLEATEKALKKALATAVSDENRQRYMAKLQALSRQR